MTLKPSRRPDRPAAEAPGRAHYAGAIPLDLLRTEQDRTATQLAHMGQQPTGADENYGPACQALADCLDLTRGCHAAYLQATDPTRRLFNRRSSPGSTSTKTTAPGSAPSAWATTRPSASYWHGSCPPEPTTSCTKDSTDSKKPAGTPRRAQQP